MPRIAGFNRTSLLDWDGCVTAVVYLPGCNFRCPFCHNRQLVLTPEDYEEVPIEFVEDYIEENREFLDGIVITGGEPTIHKDLPELARRLKRLGMKVKLDTNGTNPEMLKDLIDAGLVDFVAMDLKAPLDEGYDDLAGTKVELDDIKRSISIIMSSGIDYEFRTTMVPILLKPEDYERMAAYVGTAKKLVLQHFSPRNTIDPSFSVLKPLDEAKVRSIAERCRPYVRRLVIRGGI
ncbi:MAG TPA: anaerobic ribonucleoside-triphosphate reductase activating protein [Methanomassiliicoccales archaeon]|nr:anaerobic ribonucleoside-triphosphate reductase activating protein [Methanomassiliicoccales archaeon]